MAEIINPLAGSPESDTDIRSILSSVGWGSEVGIGIVIGAVLGAKYDDSLGNPGYAPVDPNYPEMLEQYNGRELYWRSQTEIDAIDRSTEVIDQKIEKSCESPTDIIEDDVSSGGSSTPCQSLYRSQIIRAKDREDWVVLQEASGYHPEDRVQHIVEGGTIGGTAAIAFSLVVAGLIKRLKQP